MKSNFELLRDIHALSPGDVLIEYPINGSANSQSFNPADRLNQQRWEVTNRYEDSCELSIPQKEMQMTLECGIWLDDMPVNKTMTEMISEGIWWVRRKKNK